MKRNRKGTTRTGAIPTCMAEVSPTRARVLLWSRMMRRANKHVLERHELTQLGGNLALDLFRGRSDGYDGVQLFARTHPPLPAHPTPDQARAYLRSMHPMARRLFLGKA